MQLLLMMMNSNPALASQFEGNSWIKAERERMEKAKKLQVSSHNLPGTRIYSVKLW